MRYKCQHAEHNNILQADTPSGVVPGAPTSFEIVVGRHTNKPKLQTWHRAATGQSVLPLNPEASGLVWEVLIRNQVAGAHDSCGTYSFVQVHTLSPCNPGAR